MAMKYANSPFARVAALSHFSNLTGVTAGARRSHRVFTHLLGAARNLAAGGLALSRSKSTKGSSLTLVVVDGPDAALDVVTDLRALVALHEAVTNGAETSGGSGAKKGKSAEKIARNAENDESWADPGAARILPANLRKGLLLESALFPAWDVLPTEADRPEGLTLAGRRAVTDRLRDIRRGADGVPSTYVIAAPVAALLQPCESPGLQQDVIRLRKGEERDPIILGRSLGEAGYDRVGQVEVRGEYALRGGILDIFPHTADTPYRIDFFGETIESIKPFDPLTQRSEEEIETLAFADASPAALRKLFSPAENSKPHSLLDHLPADALIVFQEPLRVRQRAELYAASLISGKSVSFTLRHLFDRLEAFDTLQFASDMQERPHEPKKKRGKAKKRGADIDALDEADAEAIDANGADGTATDGGEPFYFGELSDGEPEEIACTTAQRLHGSVDEHAQAWKTLIAAREQVLLFCETPGHRQRLSALLSEAGVLPAENVRLVLGKLSGEFDLRACGLLALSDREIMGIGRHAAAVKAVKKQQATDTIAIQHFMELQIGDYVVHAAHGIARYLGLARLEKNGRTEDYLTLLFNSDVKLYVPAAHISWVSKYIGGHASLELSTLGSKVWARKKERAQAAIRDIAEDLLKVQAARRSLPGIVYPGDTEWQKEFENTFPYDETADQLSAIAAIKKDMQGTCPMDRLICGDVGFGKTEVALRAAFKAATSGKQVAVLAPTTLLVEQHGRTFRERMAGYPLTVEVLSRFKTAREQKRTLERLASGRVDVVIGTHRLLQKDVHFKDLGLAIVDEEQRFGVEHKEFFKVLRKSVDVLTLTATPIPRTLHMAMLGLRDISNLSTPPRNRRAIQTKVARASDDLLRRAILREISRAGQVFIVHPRVRDIHELAERIQSLAPEARIAVGHGQMGGDELEDVMGAFLRAEIDVLVSTTIVESGLDIPTANTIIVHEADRFGLAELHQLRGRVGRSDIQAYCYLLLPETSTITPEALRRLRALEEFDELGAGFQLALKDLEIRGAGNVLGRQQSGEIAEIGYDLYCKLLESTVRGLKGEVREDELEVNLQLRGAAFIPEEYVQDEKVVLELYRRVESTSDNAGIDVLRAEIEDRFGEPPVPVLRLFEESKLRRLARMAGVPYAGIDPEEGRLILKLHQWDLKMTDRALRGMQEARSVRVLDAQTLSIGLTLRAKGDEMALREQVRNLFEALVETRKRYGTSLPPAPQQNSQVVTK
jgi:transcription-repair coupling factor (superfamily II helicase)